MFTHTINGVDFDFGAFGYSASGKPPEGVSIDFIFNPPKWIENKYRGGGGITVPY